MSDETPRELTPDQVEGLTRNAEAHVELRQAVKVLPDVLLALCHMARRGARAAMAARLTDAVLKAARTAQREAFEARAYLGPPLNDAAQAGNEAMRDVLLDALTGAGEEE